MTKTKKRQIVKTILVALILIAMLCTAVGCKKDDTEGPLKEEEPILLGSYQYGLFSYKSHVWSYDPTQTILEEHRGVQYLMEEQKFFNSPPFIKQQGVGIIKDMREYFGSYVKVYDTKAVFYDENFEKKLTYAFDTKIAMKDFMKDGEGAYVFAYALVGKYRYIIESIGIDHLHTNADMFIKMDIINFKTPTKDLPIKSITVDLWWGEYKF